jgi:hypothetical protein
MESPAEIAGALLHCVEHTPTEAVANHARALMTGALEPGRVPAEVLLPYARAAWGADAEIPEGPARRFVGWIAIHGAAGKALRRHGLLTTEHLASEFPAHFAVYLDSVDPRDAEDMEEFSRLLLEVGAPRILASKDRLLREEEMLAGDRCLRLLSSGHPAVRDVVRLLLLVGDARHRDRAAARLRELLAAVPEACALRLAPDPGALPDRYLQALCEDPPGGGDRLGLSRQASSLLCDFVRSGLKDRSRRALALEAIRALATHPSVGAITLLKDIARSAWRLRGRAPRAMRHVARDVLRVHEGVAARGIHVPHA